MTINSIANKTIIAIDAISYKIHSAVGFVIGILASVIMDSIGKIFLTLVLGIAGAIGAGLGKAIFGWGKKKWDRCKKRRKEKEDAKKSKQELLFP